MPKSEIILALDLATVTGWAAGPPGADPPASDTVRIGHAGSSLARFLDAAVIWLEEIFAARRPTILVVEQSFISHGRTSRDVAAKLMSLNGLAQMVALRSGLPDERICEADAGEVCRFFTGSAAGGSDARKARNQARCRALGWGSDSPDEADALALWRFTENAFFPHARREPLTLA